MEAELGRTMAHSEGGGDPFRRRGRLVDVTLRTARRIVVALLGATVLAIGLVMIVLPGPAIVVIPAGLAILGLEFAWARRWLQQLRSGSREALQRWGLA